MKAAEEQLDEQIDHLRSLYASGRVLAAEEEVNPALNAIVEVQHDRVLQLAAAADRAVMRGEDVGPLNGVPITIKDSFHVAGWHTTWGEQAFKDYVTRGSGSTSASSSRTSSRDASYLTPRSSLPRSARMATRAAWSTYFSEMDVFLSPVNFTPAIPHDSRPFAMRSIMTPADERRYDEQPFWIAPASLAGLPTVVTPVGTTPAGLPIGVQILGPRFEDDTAITFAALLAELAGGYQPPPLALPVGTPGRWSPAVNARCLRASRSRRWRRSRRATPHTPTAKGALRSLLPGTGARSPAGMPRTRCRPQPTRGDDSGPVRGSPRRLRLRMPPARRRPSARRAVLAAKARRSSSARPRGAGWRRRQGEARRPRPA
jgi:hypothetical protein